MLGLDAIASQPLSSLGNPTLPACSLPDNFSGSSLGACWESSSFLVGASVPAVSGGVASQGGGSYSSILYGTAFTTGGVLSESASVSISVDFDQVGLAFIEPSASNGYVCALKREPGASQWVLYRIDAGVATQVNNGFFGSLTYPVTFLVEYDPSTDTFTFKTDGTTRGTPSHSTYTSLERAGFVVIGASTLDWFDASPIASGGGPTDYPRSLSSTLSHAATIARAVALARSSTSSIAHSAAVAAITGKPRALSSSVAHSAAVVRAEALTRAQSSSVSVSASLSRSTSASRPLSSSIAHSASLARVIAFTRSLSSSIASSASLARLAARARALSSSIAHSAAVSRAQALTRALSISIASTISVARTVIPGAGGTDFPRSLSSTIAHSASVARAAQAARSLSSTIASSASVARALVLARALSVSLANTAAVSRAQTLTRAIAFSLAHSASLSRLAARARSLSSTIAHSASLGRLAERFRALTSSVAHSASLARAGSFARSLAASVAHTASAVFAVVSSSFVPPTRSRMRIDRNGGEETRRESGITRESSRPSRRGSRMRR